MELKIKVWAAKSHYSTDLNYVLSDSDMSTEGWVELKEVTIQFEPITMEQFAAGAVPLLRAKKAQIYVRAEEAVKEVEDEIQSLLALPESV